MLLLQVNPASFDTTAHIKSYLKYRKIGNDTMLDYLVIGSHNLSMAAWGCLQKSNTQLFIRSYEMSVLFHPSRVKNNSRQFSLTPNHRLLGITNKTSTNIQKPFLIAQGIFNIVIITSSLLS